MATIQTINNKETGLSVRSKINGNFSSLKQATETTDSQLAETQAEVERISADLENIDSLPQIQAAISEAESFASQAEAAEAQAEAARDAALESVATDYRVNTLAQRDALTATTGQTAFVLETGRFYSWSGSAWTDNGPGFLDSKADKTDVVEINGRLSTARQLGVVDAGAVVPLIVDVVGRGVAGFNTSSSRFFPEPPEIGKVVEILDANTQAALVSPVDSKIPFLLDQAGKGVCGFDVDRNEFWPAQALDLSSYTDTALPDEFAVTAFGRVHIQQYGQSLSMGGSTVGYSTNAFYGDLALTFGQGPRSTKEGSAGFLPGTDTRIPLIENDLSNTTLGASGGSGETGLMGLCHELIERRAMRGLAPIPLFASTAGRGGYTIAQLQMDQAWAQVLRDQLDESKARALESGEAWDVAAITFMQGESDGGTDPATYKSAISALMDDINDHLALSHSVPWLTYQTPRSIARTQFELTRDLPGYLHATAIYDLVPMEDGTHLTAFSYHKMGRRFGRAADQLISGIMPKRIWPKGATMREGLIRWAFDVPQKPLRVDSSLPATTNFGFSLAINGEVQSSATYSVSIEFDTVIFDVSELTIDSDDAVEVRYALDYRAVSSLWMASGRTGQITDSTEDTFFYAGDEYAMPYVMPHCYSPVLQLKTGSDTQ
jgi:hypothetical protein